jgi:hypothetical protein
VNASLPKMPLSNTLKENGTWNTMNAGKPTKREKARPLKRNAMLLRAASMTPSMMIATLNGKIGRTTNSIMLIGDQNSTCMMDGTTITTGLFYSLTSMKNMAKNGTVTITTHAGISTTRLKSLAIKTATATLPRQLLKSISTST